MRECALYNKYRPKQLDELVGQKYVVATFKQAALNDKFSQTYIFTGNRGCGKTTTARIVANLLTCENVKDGKVCGKCRACQNRRRRRGRRRKCGLIFILKLRHVRPR
jgi:DNA polymerase-3 subunit gamma/tau